MAAWWDRAPDLFESAFQNQQGRTRAKSYRFGLGHFELDSDDAELNQRFRELYPEGGGPDPQRDGGPSVRCSIRSLDDPSVAAIRFDDPEELDPVEFCRAVFPDRSYVPGPTSREGWRTLQLGEGAQQPLIAMNGARAMADRRQLWQPLVANMGVNRVLRLQRELVFFHAAATTTRGRGALFLGPKGAGKTTLALALASRGHGYLSDEVGAVRTRDGRMFPFRRAASIRQGERGAEVSRRLGAGSFAVETFPDGSPRILANVADLFPGADGAEATLACAFFLRPFEPRPRIERFAFGLEHFPLLTPLGSSFWGIPTGRRMVQLSRLLGAVRCYHLSPGQPDETVEALESLFEEPSH